jgi:hypothetical protein
MNTKTPKSTCSTKPNVAKVEHLIELNKNKRRAKLCAFDPNCHNEGNQTHACTNHHKDARPMKQWLVHAVETSNKAASPTASKYPQQPAQVLATTNAAAYIRNEQQKTWE